MDRQDAKVLIPRLRVARFHSFVGSGRTSPARCGCEDDGGAPAGDYVVKLTGAMERGATGHVCELAASRLATHFGIAAPAPALIHLDLGFARFVAKQLQATNPVAAERFGRSAGWNFGSVLLTGIQAWPVDKPIPEAQWQAAAEVFAFDALIENPDRRYQNPNLFTRGNEAIVLDHESAFAFLLAILPSPEPWKLRDAEARYLEDHALFRRLKGKAVDLARFRDALSRLADDAILAAMLPVAELPTEWNNGSWEKIAGHLRLVGSHADEFVEAVRRRLV